MYKKSYLFSIALAGLLMSCNLSVLAQCASSSSSTVSGPHCSADVFTITVNNCVIPGAPDQDALLLYYDFDSSTPHTDGELYDDVTSINDQTELLHFGEFYNTCGGTDWNDLNGFLVEDCTPLVINLYLMPINEAANTIDRSCPIEGPISLTIYPANFTAEITGTTDPSCAPMVRILAADGITACRAAEAVACGDSYNYTADFPALNGAPPNCNQPALQGTVNCEATCGTGCAANNGTLIFE